MLKARHHKTTAVQPPTAHLKNHPSKTGHCWRSKDELLSNVLLCTPTYGRTSVGWRVKTYLHQLCSLKDLPKAMNDRDGWKERQSGKFVLSERLDDDDDDDDCSSTEMALALNKPQTWPNRDDQLSTCARQLLIQRKEEKEDAIPMTILCPVDWGLLNTPTASLQRDKTNPNECPGHDTKQFDGEVPLMLKFLRNTEYPFHCHHSRSTLQNWIIWNRTVLTIKLSTYTKRNCLK